MPQEAHQTQFHADFRKYLNRWFGLADLETLCFDLDIPFDEVRGDGLDSTIVRLIFYCERHGRISDLLRRCSELRPHAPLPESVYEPKVLPFCIMRISQLPRRIKRMIVVGISAIVLVVTLGLLGHKSICSSLVFDTLDDASTWNTFTLTETSRSFLVSLPGKRNKAAAISYSLREGEWFLMTKDIRPGALKGTEGISFDYAGSGAPITIEIKFFYENNAIFSAERNRATNTQSWEYFAAPYTSFACWPSTGCSEKDKLNLDRVVKLDIAVSSKNGGEPGSGIVLVDDLRFVKPGSWMCAR